MGGLRNGNVRFCKGKVGSKVKGGLGKGKIR